MPRTTQQIANANFGKGIITETGPLGYPENSVKDMMNMELQRNGSVRVRNGLVVPTLENVLNIPENTPYSIHYWDNPANNNEGFLVVQVGYLIYCLSTSGDYLGQRTITASTLKQGRERTDLRDVLGATSTPKGLRSVQSRSRLYMTSPQTGAFFLEYLPEGRLGSADYENAQGATNSSCVQIVTISPKYRDLYGLQSSIAVDTRPTEEIPEHHYNILNAGWPEDDYQFFHRGRYADSYPDFAGGKYPALSDYYWDGWGLNQNRERPQYEEFLPSLILRKPQYNTPSPMGHFILDVINPDRSDLSGVRGLPDRGKTQGPSTIGFFAGRTWYAGFTGGGFEDNVLFSNVLPFQSSINFDEEANNFLDKYASQCYQKNDPTAREVNDLVDDDGGVIPIPGLGAVRGLVSLKNSIVVISDKGAWSISGGIDPFSANNYTVNKITSVGCVSSNSIVELEGTAMYWGYGDIVFIGETESGQSAAQSLTDNTIKTLYIDIPLDYKRAASGHYDIVNKKVYWSYSSNQCLVFDNVLQAFTQYEFNGDIDGAEVSSIVHVDKKVVNYDVSVRDEDVTAREDNVVIYETVMENFNNQVIVCVKKGNYLLFANFDTENSGNYYDLVPREFSDLYGSYPVSAYVEVGANGFGDLMRKKQAFKVFCYFATKESLVIPADYQVSNGEITVKNERSFEPMDASSCYAQGRWEWAEREVSGQFSRPQQAYVQPKLAIVSNPTFNGFISYDESLASRYGAVPNIMKRFAVTAVAPAYDVTTRKMRIRGRGRTLNMHFENEPGKGFHLLGWAAPVLINKRP